MALISQFISIKLCVPTRMTAIILRIACTKSTQPQTRKYRGIINDRNIAADRDGNSSAGNASTAAAGGRGAYQVIERPVWCSAATQQVRRFGWLASGLRKSEVGVPRQVRQFATESKTSKRKMVNKYYCARIECGLFAFLICYFCTACILWKVLIFVHLMRCPLLNVSHCEWIIMESWKVQ